jgi:hypothetical protein
MDKYMDFSMYGRRLTSSPRGEGEAMIANRRLHNLTRDLEEGEKVHISFLDNSFVSLVWLVWAFVDIDPLKIFWKNVEFRGSTPIQVVTTVMDFGKGQNVATGMTIHSPLNDVPPESALGPIITPKQAVDDLYG